jgi:hypothetical protein
MLPGYGNRIAQIFREWNVDISTQHLMRAIRLFIAEGEGAKREDSVAQGTGEAELAKERRRAGRAVRQKAPPTGQHRDERQRSSPGR